MHSRNRVLAPQDAPPPAQTAQFHGLSVQVWMWIGFGVIVSVALAFDLFIWNRKAHVVSTKESLIWTLVWITLAMTFAAGIWLLLDKGEEKAMLFLTAFILEKSLSVDNLFVFLVVFSYFSVPKGSESRVLKYGILGALVLRAIFIYVGSTALQHFDFVMYIFGAILLWTAFKLLVKAEVEVQPDKNIFLKLFRKMFAVAPSFDGARFWTRVDGRRMATPLLAVLVVVEGTDILFALDSVPACLGVSTDPFIVFTSNVFAIMGLRALFFVLANIMAMFRFLKYGLVAILAFIGIKMILETPKVIHIPTSAALGVVGGVLALSVVLSLLIPKKPEPPAPPPECPPQAPPPDAR